MTAPGRYAIVTDHPGWHGQQLQQALKRHDRDSCFVSLRECRIEIDHKGAHIDLPGFDGQLPAGVFVREVPGGTLEEVIFYLDVLHALEAKGIGVYNDAGAIERSVDKVRASFLFAHHGIPTPRTFVARSLRQTRAFLAHWFETHESIVAKPIFGSQGKGLMRLTRETPHPNYDLYHGMYYLQEYIESAASGSCDWRVLVVKGRAQAAMRREGNDWISNIANGGQGYPAALDSQLSDLAQRATSAVDMSYAGVDLMQDREGAFWVTEINSIPAWRGLQQVSQQDISELLIEGFLAHCHKEA